MKPCIFSAVALSVVCASAGHAFAGIGNACEVKETPDGFVAIRAAPSAKGALVAKAKPGQIVEVLDDAKGKPRASGLWWRVRHYPGESLPQPGEAGHKDVREGWIYSRLIDGCG